MRFGGGLPPPENLLLWPISGGFAARYRPKRKVLVGHSPSKPLRQVFIAGLLRAVDGVVRENRADQQYQPVKVEQAEMADRVEPVGVVQRQRYRHGDDWC